MFCMHALMAHFRAKCSVNQLVATSSVDRPLNLQPYLQLISSAQTLHPKHGQLMSGAHTCRGKALLPNSMLQPEGVDTSYDSPCLHGGCKTKRQKRSLARACSYPNSFICCIWGMPVAFLFICLEGHVHVST